MPVMGLLLAAGPRLLPEYRDPDAGRLDILSAAMSLVAVLALVYGSLAAAIVRDDAAHAVPAGDALAHGVQAVTLTAAIVMLGAAAMVALVARRRGAGAERRVTRASEQPEAA